MIHKIDYTFMGTMQSIGILPIRRSSGLRIDSIGSIDITYNIFGRVLTIDSRECTYNGWFSPMISIGEISIHREKYKWWSSISKVFLVENLKVGYDHKHRVSSIGDLQIKYGRFGRMIEIITTTNYELTRQEQIVLAVVIIETEKVENTSST